MRQRHQFVVDLGTDTMTPQEGMDGEGKVEGRTTRRHRLYLTFWGEDKYLAGKEVQFDGVEEVHCIGLRVVENLLDGAQPVVQFCLVLRIFLVLQTVLIFPMGCKPLLCHLIHAVRAYLHLYPLTCLRHQSDVQGLITVGFRMTEPVTHTVRM